MPDHPEQPEQVIVTRPSADDFGPKGDRLHEGDLPPDFAGELTKDQLLRLSAVIGIYKSLELYFADPLAKSWVTRPNAGPLFGGHRPVETAIEGGLPQILAIRTYLDALRGGA